MSESLILIVNGSLERDEVIGRHTKISPYVFLGNFEITNTGLFLNDWLGKDTSLKIISYGS